MDRYGEYGGTSTSGVIAAIAEADASPSISGIVLYVDSPGGTYDGTPELGTAITKCRKPVTAYVAGMACSAALWAASQADAIYASESSTIGSIGCFCVLTDITGALEKMGVKATLISSGGIKGAGADGRVTDEMVADEQRVVNEITSDFISAVSDGRQIPRETVRAIADGRVFIGKQAMAEKLVDGIGTLDAAIMELQRMTLDAFKAYAAEHPDAVAPFIEQGKNAALADLTSPAKAADLKAAFPDDPHFVIDHLNDTMDAAKAAYCDVLRGKLAAADERANALASENESLKAKVAELSGGQKPVATAAITAEPAPVDPDAELKKQGMNDTQIAAYRKAQSEGRIRVFAPAAKK